MATITGASVSVTAASEAALDGTFAWTPAPGQEGPALTDRKFRHDLVVYHQGDSLLEPNAAVLPAD